MENKLMHLYEISDAFNKISEMAETDESLNDYLDAVLMDLVDKVDNIVMYRRTLELTCDALDSEIDRLTRLKIHHALTAQKLKSYLSYNLHKMGKDKLETEKFRLSFRKSESIEIVDESLIADEYKSVKMVELTDKIRIKKAIKEGIEVKGAILKTTNNLQIK